MALPSVGPAEMEFDLDKALEEVPIHVEDPPLLPPPPPQPSDRTSAYCGDLPPPPTPLGVKSVCLGELPPVEHKTLEHRTKFRPKPKKRTKPSRPPVGLHQREIPKFPVMPMFNTDLPFIYSHSSSNLSVLAKYKQTKLCDFADINSHGLAKRRVFIV